MPSSSGGYAPPRPHTGTGDPAKTLGGMGTVCAHHVRMRLQHDRRAFFHSVGSVFPHHHIAQGILPPAQTHPLCLFADIIAGRLFIFGQAGNQAQGGKIGFQQVRGSKGAVMLLPLADDRHLGRVSCIRPILWQKERSRNVRQHFSMGYRSAAQAFRNL